MQHLGMGMTRAGSAGYGPAMTQTDDDLTEALAGERRLLDPHCRADPACLRALLHPDFREYGASGNVWTREDVLQRLPRNPQINGQASGFHAEHLSPEVIQVTFTITGARASLRSSLWVRQGEGPWQMRFHQATLLPNP